MDMSLVMAALGAQAGGTQMQIATAIARQNAQAERSTVLTLLGTGQQSSSLANVGPGVGGSVDVSV